MKPVPMTVTGIKKLEEELQELKKIHRPRIISAIKEARSHGDLKENAEYRAAREEQSFCEGRIQDIEMKLANAQVIDVKKMHTSGKVIFGSTVKILNISTKKTFIYQIVGDDEANFKENLISIYSPISRGLIGKSIHEIVNIKTPGGIVKYKILKIDYI